jgi:hypothetical protein
MEADEEVNIEEVSEEGNNEDDIYESEEEFEKEYQALQRAKVTKPQKILVNDEVFFLFPPLFPSFLRLTLEPLSLYLRPQWGKKKARNARCSQRHQAAIA